MKHVGIKVLYCFKCKKFCDFDTYDLGEVTVKFCREHQLKLEKEVSDEVRTREAEDMWYLQHKNEHGRTSGGV